MTLAQSQSHGPSAHPQITLDISALQPCSVWVDENIQKSPKKKHLIKQTYIGLSLAKL